MAFLQRNEGEILEFLREGMRHEAGLQETEARFYIPVQTLTDFDFLNLTDLAAFVDSKIESFNTNGSGWELDHIISATLATCCYRPAQGSSYIETPECLAKKQAVINVQNTKDELCFAWAVLSAIHPPKRNPHRISKYKQYLGELDLTGLSFPLKVRDVPKFEKLNPHNIRKRKCIRNRPANTGIDPALHFPRQATQTSH